MTEPEAAPPSELETLARNVIATAQLADVAMEGLHDALNTMLEAVHGAIQFLVAENAELKFRLAGLDK